MDTSICIMHDVTKSLLAYCLAPIMSTISSHEMKVAICRIACDEYRSKFWSLRISLLLFRYQGKFANFPFPYTSRSNFLCKRILSTIPVQIQNDSYYKWLRAFYEIAWIIYEVHTILKAPVAILNGISRWRVSSRKRESQKDSFLFFFPLCS